MTKQEFLDLQLNQVSQIYIGKDRCCRCGCGGDYIATSYMDQARSDVNDKLALELLQRAQKVAVRSRSTEYADIYVNVPIGGRKAITVYFDEVKK